MEALPDSVLPRFLEAGWYPGRVVVVPERSDTPSGHPALPVLASFGGLHVRPATEAGVECAPNDLAFDGEPIVEKVVADEAIAAWEDLLETRLVGVAFVHRGHGRLYVAADGRCFSAGCVDDAFAFEGMTFATAVEQLLLGYRAQPLLRPDQTTVTLYGTSFHRGNRALYDYGRASAPLTAAATPHAPLARQDKIIGAIVFMHCLLGVAWIAQSLSQALPSGAGALFSVAVNITLACAGFAAGWGWLRRRRWAAYLLVAFYAVQTVHVITPGFVWALTLGIDLNFGMGWNGVGAVQINVLAFAMSTWIVARAFESKESAPKDAVSGGDPDPESA